MQGLTIARTRIKTAGILILDLCGRHVYLGPLSETKFIINIKAQKKGCRIVAILNGAVAKVREYKPGIPKIADNGIPVTNEVILEKCIDAI